MKFTLIALALMLFGIAFASVYVMPVYVGSGTGACTQTNATYVSCADGSNVTVGVSITAPEAPLLGSFTVWEVGNRSLIPISDMYGRECVVESGNSTTCIIGIPAFSVFSGNGTGIENIRLKFIPANYPQTAYYENTSITVRHYLNGTGRQALQAYQGAYSQFSLRENAYGNACGGYSVCNSTVQQSIAFVNRTLLYARTNMLNMDFGNALLNISFADTELKDSNATFYAFAAYSDTVVQNVISGSANITDAAALYANNTAVLESCVSSNSSKTPADYYVSGEIDAAKGLPYPDTLPAAQKYSAYASGLFRNTSSIIESCKTGKTFSVVPGFSINLPGINLGSDTEYIIIAVIIIGIVLYVRSALATRAEMRRIRGIAAEEEKKEQQDAEPEEKPESETVTHNDDEDFVQKISKGDEK